MPAQQIVEDESASHAGDRAPLQNGASSSLPADIAKWLVPSATVGFIVVGYMVQTAQESLLGLDAPNAGSSQYITAAADFFLHIVTTLAGSTIMAPAQGVSLNGHGWTLALLAIAVIAALLSARAAKALPHPWRGRIARWRPFALALLLVLIALWKFLLLDAPLAGVSGVIVDPELTDTGERAQPSVIGLLMDKGNFVRDDADGLRNIILCSRVIASVGEKRVAPLDVGCVSSQQASKDAVNGEFLAQILSMTLIVVLALALLRAWPNAHIPIVLSVLACLYALSVPYAYGKLIKTTVYDHGVVMLADDPAHPAATGTSDRRSLHALILSRTGVSTDLLVAEDGACAFGGKFAVIRVSSLSPSQVLAIRGIYRQDVIAWAASFRRHCPSLPGGPQRDNLN